MQNDPETPYTPGIDRRSFLKSAAAGTAAFATGVSLLSLARPAKAAGSLADVQTDAAKAAKELAKGRAVTLRILEPSGSLGNIKPVAERWTADTGINVEYVEVPLGEINQKVLLEAVSKAGSFDIALPASFGIPDLAESGILVDLDQLAAKYEPEGYQDSIIYKTANYYKGNFYGYETDGDAYVMFYR
jgi:multiple sugar transport system substrate-binding protein